MMATVGPRSRRNAGGAGAALELASRRGDPNSYTLPQPMLGLTGTRMRAVGVAVGKC